MRVKKSPRNDDTCSVKRAVLEVLPKEELIELVLRRDRRCEELERQNAELKKQNTELAARCARLGRQNAELTARRPKCGGAVRPLARPPRAVQQAELVKRPVIVTEHRASLFIHHVVMFVDVEDVRRDGKHTPPDVSLPCSQGLVVFFHREVHRPPSPSQQVREVLNGLIDRAEVVDIDVQD